MDVVMQSTETDGRDRPIWNFHLGLTRPDCARFLPLLIPNEPQSLEAWKNVGCMLIPRTLRQVPFHVAGSALFTQQAGEAQSFQFHSGIAPTARRAARNVGPLELPVSQVHRSVCTCWLTARGP